MKCENCKCNFVTSVKTHTVHYGGVDWVICDKCYKNIEMLSKEAPQHIRYFFDKYKSLTKIGENIFVREVRGHHASKEAKLFDQFIMGEGLNTVEALALGGIRYNSIGHNLSSQNVNLCFRHGKKPVKYSYREVFYIKFI